RGGPPPHGGAPTEPAGRHARAAGGGPFAGWSHRAVHRGGRPGCLGGVAPERDLAPCGGGWVRGPTPSASKPDQAVRAAPSRPPLEDRCLALPAMPALAPGSPARRPATANAGRASRSAHTPAVTTRAAHPGPRALSGSGRSLPG